MPTKRKQNIPGKAPRPSRNPRSRSTQVRSSSPRSAGTPTRRKPQGFSTSAPGQKFKPSVQDKGFGPMFDQVASGVTKKTLAPEVVISRRNLLIGAGAVAGAAALGGGAMYAVGQMSGSDEVKIDTITVSTDDVESLSNYEQATYTDHMKVSGRFKLDYGTLVWADNDEVAACLVPTESASPLNTVSVLFLSSGKNYTVLKAAQGASDGYEIVDVRCSESGMIWTESNAYQQSWRVYTAKLNGTELSSITQVDQGDSNWLMPSLAAIDQTAFWQVSPSTSGEAASERSALKAARFGSSDVSVPCSSKKAFATRVSACSDGVVVTPRAESTGTYYTLTKIKASDLSTADTMTLPSSMTPNFASWGKSGFNFGFSSIYSYGGGIANLGTYTPRSTATAYDYNNKKWFRFGRTPYAAPCWTGEWFFVKSTTALCGVNFANKCYFSIDTPSGCDDYGEHLVSTGNCSSVVGLSQITSDTSNSEDHALVRVFTPISSSISSAL